MPDALKLTLRDAAHELVRRHAPGGELLRVRELGADTHVDDETLKAIGYGRPLRVDVRTALGESLSWVLHTATPNPFGHERRADRVAEMLVAYDTFGDIPLHAEALDVGLIGKDGGLVSLRDTSEAYLVTSWVDGGIYADELRAVAERGHSSERDVAHARRLAVYLAELHRPVALPQPEGQAHSYRRSVRDLVGSGEGIFGIIDGYPADVPGVPSERLQALEARCVAWRWRLKGHDERLVRIHGDFHPFNVLFDEGSQLRVLDASRGCLGDAADDLTALAINYVFFALQHESWSETYQPLWQTFWRSYFEHRDDAEVVALAPPFLAWRALVLANPAWYPDIAPAVRDALLGLAEAALDAKRFTLEQVEGVFR